MEISNFAINILHFNLCFLNFIPCLVQILFVLLSTRLSLIQLLELLFNLFGSVPVNFFALLESGLLQLMGFGLLFLGWRSLNRLLLHLLIVSSWLLSRSSLDRRGYFCLLLDRKLLAQWRLGRLAAHLLWLHLGLLLLASCLNWNAVCLSVHLRLCRIGSRHLETHLFGQCLGLTLWTVSFGLLWGRRTRNSCWLLWRNVGRWLRLSQGLDLRGLLLLVRSGYWRWLRHCSWCLDGGIADSTDLIHGEEVLLLLLPLLELGLDHCLLLLSLLYLLLD